MLQLGKRYGCEQCGTESLVTKASEEGSLQCCGEEMQQQQPKKAASAD